MSHETRTEAMFPLAICILPGETIPLHIFEPRYKELIQDCRDEGILFGIPYLHSKQTGPFGTLVRLKRIYKNYDGGEMDVEVEAIGIFKIDEYREHLPVKQYSGADVKVIENPGSIQSLRLIALLNSYIGMTGAKNLNPSVVPDMTTFDVARFLNLSSEEKYKVIAQTSDSKREAYFANILQFRLRILELEEQLAGQFYLN